MEEIKDLARYSIGLIPMPFITTLNMGRSRTLYSKASHPCILSDDDIALSNPHDANTSLYLDKYSRNYLISEKSKASILTISWALNPSQSWKLSESCYWEGWRGLWNEIYFTGTEHIPWLVNQVTITHTKEASSSDNKLFLLCCPRFSHFLILPFFKWLLLCVQCFSFCFLKRKC